MRLLLVTHYMPPHHGGIERIAEDHAQAAARAGHEVRWLASREPRDTPLRERLAWGEAFRVQSWNGLERRLGVPVPVWYRHGRGIAEELVAWSELVHVHDVLYPGTTHALRAARSRSVPSLLTQHVGFVPYQRPLLRGIQRLAYATLGRRNAARATRLAYYNDGARRWLERAAGFRGPATYLPNPVDMRLFRPAESPAEKLALRRKHALRAEACVVLFVGRLVPKKGAEHVIAAAHPSFDLLLIGERGTIAVEPRPGLELRPFVAREALAELLRAADVLVLPSQGEGFPLVAQEAMASGLPVVLGDDPAYHRQLEAGAARFVAPRADAVAEALRGLALDPAERRALGLRALESARKHWGQEACHARLLTLYAELLAWKRDPPAEPG